MNMVAPPSPLSLLDPAPFERVDAVGLRSALCMAFATGDIGDVLERLVDTMPIAPSTWEPRDFAADVFLPEVLERCMPLAIGGTVHPRSKALLLRLVSTPPADRETVRWRQGVLAELTRVPSLRESVEHLFVEIVRLRALLSKTGLVRIDPFERRLGVLRSVKSVFRRMRDDFANATSGLRRVHEWATCVTAGPAMRRLEDLLDYEANVAELDVRVRFGFDGKIRDFSVIERREPESSSYHATPMARLAARIGLVLRGQSFGAHELFARLTDEVFDGLAADLTQVFPLVGDLEFYLAASTFRDGAERAGLAVTLPTFTEGGTRRLEGLWNPLIASERSSKTIPADLATMDGELVVITGPNSGGKTRWLQSIALAQLLGQAGGFVPARSATLPWATGLFVSLIEHAHADQREGRLGTELLRIRRLFESVRVGSLVVLDELCSGTNPSEGEEIFRLVVKLLAELRPSTFVTTHFLAFAARLHAENARPSPGFLQVELDGEERPTYAFIPGVATTSLAHRTAARLGVTEDALRAAIRANNPGLASQVDQLTGTWPPAHPFQ